MMKRTELKRKTPLRRTAWKARPSKKAKERRARMKLLRPLVRERCGDRCEVVIDGQRCPARMAHCHHVLPVGRGGIDDLTNLLGVCAAHHIHIHQNPHWAVTHGYLSVTMRLA